MNELTNHFTLDFSHPPKREESYTYHLGKDFFEASTGNEIQDGSVELQLTITPQTEQQLKLTFSYQGDVVVECDRCLSPLQLQIEAEEYTTVILGNALDDSDDLEITLNAQDPIYDFSWIAYELLAINLPSIRVHQNIEDCDQDVVKHLTIEQPTTQAENNQIWAELSKKIRENKEK